MIHSDNGDTKKGHIDIIDDDEALRNSLLDVLNFAGYSVNIWPSAVYSAAIGVCRLAMSKKGRRVTHD